MSMQDLIRLGQEYAPAAPTVFFSVVALIAFIKKPLELFDWIQDRRILKLASRIRAAKNPRLKKYLLDVKDEEIFRAVTGINAAGILDEILSLADRTKGKFSRRRLRDALPYMTIDSIDGRINIRTITRSERIHAGISSFSFWVLATLFILLFFVYSVYVAYQVNEGSVTVAVGAIQYIFSLVMLVGGIFIAIDVDEPGRSIQAAEGIRSFLEKEKKNA